MEAHVLAQQGDITWDQFKRGWVVVHAVFGVAMGLGGVYFSRRPRNFRQANRQAALGLIKSDVFPPGDIERAINRRNPNPFLRLSVQERLDLVLENFPIIEQVALLWNRLWSAACILAGVGLVVACVACMLLFLLFPGMQNPYQSADVPDGITLALTICLPLMGMLAGSGLGILSELRKAVSSPEQRALALDHPTRGATVKRSRWLVWEGVVLFIAPFLMTLSVFITYPGNRFELGLAGLGVFPVLTVAVIVSIEVFLHRLAPLPVLQVSADPAFSRRAAKSYFLPRVIWGIRLIQYGILGTMLMGQLLLSIISVPRYSIEILYLFLGAIGLYLLLPLLLEYLQKWWSKQQTK